MDDPAVLPHVDDDKYDDLMTEAEGTPPSSTGTGKGFRKPIDRVADAEAARKAIVEQMSDPLAAIRRQLLDTQAAASAIHGTNWSKSPMNRSAVAAEETQRVITQMAALTTDMVDLTQQSLDQATSTSVAAAKSQRFSNRVMVTSTVVAIASLGVAIVAIVT